MHPSIDKKILRYRHDGRLAIVTNLLYDITRVGWIAFLGLYLIEILLPLFVTTRISLVKLSLFLLVLTSLLIWLKTALHGKTQPHTGPPTHHRFFLIGLLIMSYGAIALAHYRFPWWSIIILLLGYITLGRYCLQFEKQRTNAR